MSRSLVCLRRYLFGLLLGTLAPMPLWAQTGAATVTGIVSDQSRAPLPGASVVATNQSTQVPYTGVSNEAGIYTITSVPIGTYTVKVELTGFKSAVTPPFTLESNQIARLDVGLELGAISETIEVTGASPILQTESATVGEVISGRTAVELPLNGRNPGQLSLILAGVVTPNPMSFTQPARSFGGGGRPYVNGHREQGNNYTLDGVDMNESIDNLIPYQPSPDALAEISVETNNYSAELGNVSGAIVNSSIKAGTNEYHGNAFEFLRDSNFDANTWANNRAGAERTQHIFGGTFGGPILRNRAFFFADYQGTRLNEPGPAVASVAPSSWRRGDFSSLLPATVIRDPRTGQPFPGNIIPQDRISPVARALLADTANYPLPTRDTGDVSGNFVGTRLRETRNHQWDARIDLSASANDRFFGRVSIGNYKAQDEQLALPLTLRGFDESPYRAAAINWNRTFGTALVSETLFGYNKVGLLFESRDLTGLGNANARYGIGGSQPIPGLSAINVGSGLNGGDGIAPFGTAVTASDTDAKVFQINQKFSWIRGRHVFKFGGQWLYSRAERFYAGNNGVLGNFTYNGSFSGFGFSDFLLDQLAVKGRGSLSEPWTHLQNRVGLFAQDDFKVTNNLTLNVGMRWEYTSPLVEVDDRQTNFDLATGRQLFAGRDGNSRALYEPYYKGFEPRVGVAWTFRDKWVLRGAYGIVQHMEGTGANLRLPLNPPFYFESEVRYDPSTGPGSIATGFEGLQAQDRISGQLRAFDPNLRPQFTQQWNLFIERQLGSKLSASVGYVAHKAEHLVTPQDGNQPLPDPGPVDTWRELNQRRPLFSVLPDVTAIKTTASNGRSNYHALQSSVRQRVSDGLEFLASYTWSKAMSDNVGYYGSAGVQLSTFYQQNAYNPEADYGPSFFDATHNFVLSGNYELPIGKGRRIGQNWSGLTDTLLGGWMVSTVLQLRTGFPITITDGRGSSRQGTLGAERPDRIGDGSVDNPTTQRWLDITAFQAAAQGTFGNSGPGILRAPGYNNVDFVLSKRFALSAQRYFTFKLEAFNLFNHPSYGPPGRDISDPANFGVITNTVNAPRTLELVFKFNF